MANRAAWHIGASGIIYGLASFLFVSGIIRRHIPLMALSLLVVFLYGEMVWGIFPGFRIDISWESHMLGAVAGLLLALWYRDEGPQRPVPFYESDEEEQEEVVFFSPGFGLHIPEGIQNDEKSESGGEKEQEKIEGAGGQVERKNEFAQGKEGKGKDQVAAQKGETQGGEKARQGGEERESFRYPFEPAGEEEENNRGAERQGYAEQQ